ncbi:MAG: hypothetical protein IT537_03130 [Hyphomicrobiales bacterium]|nr:hypothetical protein [Hyphomicrobiales bacterium]
MTGRNRMIVAWSVLGLAWVVVAAPLELYGLIQEDPDAAITLSRFVWEVSNAWPPVVFMAGLTIGILVPHFWGKLNVRFGLPRQPPTLLRYALLGFAWLAVIVLTGGGVAVFLSGLVIGMAVTKLWWPWDPRDALDRRG